MGNASNQVVVKNGSTGELEVIDLMTGEVVVSSTVPASDYAFDYKKALYICQLVREGYTFAEIELLPDMPPQAVISHWQRIDRMFVEELKLARKERGEQYHDKALTIANRAAEGKFHKDDVPAMSLAVKTYQWAAERAKPESYGNKVTHEGNPEKPILMRVINTGISRAKPDIPVAITTEVTDVSKEGSTSREDEEDQSQSDV